MRDRNNHGTFKRYTDFGLMRPLDTVTPEQVRRLRDRDHILQMARGMDVPIVDCMTDDFTVWRGDCLSVLHKLDTGSVDYVVTDPPYSSGGRQQAAARNQVSKSSMDGKQWFTGDNMGSDTYVYFLRAIGKQLERVVKPGGHVYMFTDWRQYTNVVTAMESIGFSLRNVIVWTKNRGAAMGSFWRGDHEWIPVFTKGQPNKLAHRSTFNHIATSKPGGTMDRIHPTQKPIKLLSYITSCLTPGVILDPFMGSGTTGVAAAMNGHKFIGVEQNQIYSDYAIGRIKQAYQNPALFLENAEARDDV